MKNTTIIIGENVLGVDQGNIYIDSDNGRDLKFVSGIAAMPDESRVNFVSRTKETAKDVQSTYGITSEPTIFQNFIIHKPAHQLRHVTK